MPDALLHAIGSGDVNACVCVTHQYVILPLIILVLPCREVTVASCLFPGAGVVTGVSEDPAENSSLKRHEQPLPTHAPGMEEHLAVGGEALADVSGLPGVAGHVER